MEQKKKYTIEQNKKNKKNKGKRETHCFFFSTLIPRGIPNKTCFTADFTCFRDSTLALVVGQRKFSGG